MARKRRSRVNERLTRIVALRVPAVARFSLISVRGDRCWIGVFLHTGLSVPSYARRQVYRIEPGLSLACACSLALARAERPCANVNTAASDITRATWQ